MIADGTSMATPYVAGVAAKVWSHFPHCTNHQIRNVLLRSAAGKGCDGSKGETCVEGKGCNAFVGYGIVDAKAAYDLLLKDGCSAGDRAGYAKGGCKQLKP